MDEKFIKSALNCSPKEFCKRYKAYKEAEENFKKIYEPFKETLIEAYSQGNELPANIIIDNIKLTYVSPSTRTSIDTKKLKEEEPEIAKKFTKTTDVAATFRLENI